MMSRSGCGAAVLVAATLSAAGVVAAPAVRADAVAYLVNVTVRPGYDFPNADAAIAYGHGVCEKVGHTVSYGNLMADVKADFGTNDEFQASYLISQAVGELCPNQIWQLRQSAGGYRPEGV